MEIKYCPYCGSCQITLFDDDSWYKCDDCNGEFVVMNMND